MKKFAKLALLLVVPLMVVALFVLPLMAGPKGVWPDDMDGNGRPDTLETRTILLADPENCGNYFSCSQGVPILMHCPDGLHFNDELDVCDWPDRAGCDPKAKVTKTQKSRTYEKAVYRYDPVLGRDVFLYNIEETETINCCQSGGQDSCDGHGGSCPSGPEWK